MQTSTVPVPSSSLGRCIKASRSCRTPWSAVTCPPKHHLTVSAAKGRQGAENAGPQEEESRISVFQVDPPRGHNYSLLDVRDAIEACSCTSSAKEREQCFMTFGLDSKSVDRYYEPIIRLEEAIDHGDRVGKRMVGAGGLMMFLLLSSKLA